MKENKRQLRNGRKMILKEHRKRKETLGTRTGSCTVTHTNESDTASATPLASSSVGLRNKQALAYAVMSALLVDVFD